MVLVDSRTMILFREMWRRPGHELGSMGSMIMWVAGIITGIDTQIYGGGMYFLVFYYHTSRHFRIKPHHIMFSEFLAPIVFHCNVRLRVE